MKIRLLSYTIIILLAMLSFKPPYITFAQQNATEIELTAKMDAERDANTDTNKLTWFTVGAATCFIGSMAGVLVGHTIGSNLTPDSEYITYTMLDTGTIVALTGCIIGGTSPLIGIYYYFPSDPPSYRLLGKSPEYVESFTKAYKEKTKLLRTRWAAGGGGCLALSATGLMGLALYGSLGFYNSF